MLGHYLNEEDKNRKTTTATKLESPRKINRNRRRNIPDATRVSPIPNPSEINDRLPTTPARTTNKKRRTRHHNESAQTAATNCDPQTAMHPALSHSRRSDNTDIPNKTTEHSHYQKPIIVIKRTDSR